MPYVQPQHHDTESAQFLDSARQCLFRLRPGQRRRYRLREFGAVYVAAGHATVLL